MFDPFFAIAALGAPIALVFLVFEARRNTNTPPSVTTCFVALFAGYGVYVWLLVASDALFGAKFDELFRRFQLGLGVLAFLVVGVPFAVSARKRRRRASTDL